MKTLALHLLLAATSAAFARPAIPGTPSTRPAPSMIQRSNYAALPQPAGPYSTAVRHRDTLYLSGMTAFGTAAQGQGLAREADAILQQIQKIAHAEGLTLQNLVKVTIFVTTLEDLDGLRQALFKHYEGALPASSLVRVAGLFSPEVSVEVEAVLGFGADRNWSPSSH